MADIRDALLAAGLGLRQIGLAEDLGAAQRETIAWPSAWVVALGEQAGPNRYSNCDELSQRVTLRFGVILAVKDIADRTGGQALSTAETLRVGIITALARLTPSGADGACLPVSGRLMGGIGRDGAMFWQDDFTVEFSRRIQGA